MSEQIRGAAAVMLTRGSGTALEVFLVERNPKLKYFGGAVAFPGGVVAKEDGDPDIDYSDDALRRCAVRELFEETGVLLGAPEDSTAPADREALRRALLAAERGGPPSREFAALRQADLTVLERICRILTPPIAPVRFDTVFFRAALPSGEAPTVWPGELVAGAFWTPKAALAKWSTGDLRLAPPVLILLELLAATGSPVGFAEFVESADALAREFDRGLLPPVRFSPGIVLASLKTPTLPPATTTNTCLIGNERVFVVDPGTPEPSEMERLLDMLATMEDAGREIAGILLTHHHPDHVGGLAALAREVRVPVHAHRLTFERIPVALDKRDRFERRELRDGETIDLGVAPDGTPDWKLAALHTPGHARGHLVFGESRYGAALVGDMISTVSTIVIDPPEGHMATYLASLQKLLELPLRVLYPAHGPPVYDGARVVRHYLEHRKAREDKLVAALRNGPATVEELLPVVYADVIPAILPVAARSLEAGLEKLAEERRAVRSGALWSVMDSPTIGSSGEATK